MKKSTLLHLRIPFALYLLPIFAFAASQQPLSNPKIFFISFIAIHLFLYPAANGYNSYFDKDTESIGGLKSPPPVTLELYNVSLIFDLIAVGLGILINWQFALMVAIYGAESKAYSHPKIRLKKYTFLSSLVTSIFQGGFAYMMSFLALHQLRFDQLFDKNIVIPASLCSLTFLGIYPLTQVYQHREDALKGEHTISIKLGLLGSFIFSFIIFLIADLGYYLYVVEVLHKLYLFLILQIFLSPMTIYFFLWNIAVLKDIAKANFRNTMLFYKITTISLVAYFFTITVIENF